MMSDPVNAQRRLLSAVAEYLAGTGSAADLSQAAALALTRYEDPPESIVALAAAATSASYDELGPLARAAVRDMGYPELTLAFRSKVLALDLAQDVVAGNVPAGVGASQLWETGRYTDEGADQFGVFSELADEWESNLAKRGELEVEIRQKASQIVAESGNSLA